MKFKIFFPLIVVVLIAVGIRLFFAIDVLHKPADPTLIISNGEAARNFAEGKGLIVDLNFLEGISEKGRNEGRIVDPEDVNLPIGLKPQYKPFYSDESGYPIFLGLLWKATGAKRFIFVQLFQLGLAAFAIVGVFVIARSLFNSLALAYVAALFYALYIPEAKLSVLPHQYALIGPLTVFSAWLMTGMLLKKNTSWIYLFSAVLGLVIGTGAVMRSTLLLLPLIAAIFIFWSFNFRRAVILISTVGIVFLAMVGPVFFRNISQFGEARVARRVFWHSVAVGLGQFPNPWRFFPVDGSIHEFVKKERPDLALESYPNAESEKFLKSTILAAIKENPLWYAGTILERIPMAIFPFHLAIIGGETKPLFENDRLSFFRVPYSLIKLSSAFIASLWILIALVGMWLYGKHWRKALPLFLIWGYFIGVHSAIFVQTFYLHAISFVYAIFSAYAVWRIYHKFKILSTKA